MGNLFYRDVKYLFDVMLSVWMFATSVVYPVDRVGGWLAPVLALNPLTPIIDAYRNVILLGEMPGPGFYAAGAIASGLLFVAWFLLPSRRIRICGESLTWNHGSSSNPSGKSSAAASGTTACAT